MPTATTTTAVNNSETIFSGQIMWETENGNVLPLRETKVELIDKEVADNTVMDSCFTDEEGAFTFVFDNPDEWYQFENGDADILLRIYPISKTVDVHKTWVLPLNYIDTEVIENVTTGDHLQASYCIPYDNTNNIVKSMHVQQGMVVGERFATAMGMQTTEELNVYYPVTEDTAFCVGDWFSGIGSQYFDGFDVLIHEYGHFVEANMDTYGCSVAEYLLYNPKHNERTDHFEDKDNKEYAMKLTWSEAWATAFSQIAQEYYASEYVGINGFADHKTIGNQVTDYEVFQKDSASCEAQELAVTAFLWDLYDAYDGKEPDDNIALGAKRWWTRTTQSGTYTLTDFMHIVEQEQITTQSQIGELLGEHQIAPSGVCVPNISAVNATTAPQVNWCVNGSINNPNNRFQVVIWNEYGDLLWESENLENTAVPHNQQCQYTIPTATWRALLQNFHGTVNLKIAIRAYNTTTPISGPYTSKMCTVTVTLPTEQTETMEVWDRYLEERIYLHRSQFFEYHITFSTAGNKVIQTFGELDTTLSLYAPDGRLLATDYDDGYDYNAFIAYEVQANIQYTIRVEADRPYLYGMCKLSIVAANHIRTDLSENFTNYESIYCVTNRDDYINNSIIERDFVRLIAFRPSNTGEYNISIKSDCDTYLYIIDPRSTEALVLNVDYNDDGGEGMNAQICRTLEEDIPYLIIFCAYNPHSVIDYEAITIVISNM